MEPHGPDQQPHAPPPSLWPVGFAVGIAVLLTGVVVGWFVAALGAVIALIFGVLWVRDLGGGGHAAAAAHEAPAPVGARGGHEPGPALPLADDGEIERFPRSKFLEASTLGLGGVIGGLITVPVAGFAVLPTYLGQAEKDIDIGPVDAFPEGEWQVVTFMSDPEKGEVSRRTIFVRHNGALDGQPSLTILSNRCVHLGCPVQPSGPLDDEKKESVRTSNTLVTRIPAQPAAFTCPCHGGAYDLEGNRTAGPPVRALDRYAYEIRNGRVFLTQPYSVGEVDGEGTEAVIKAYDFMNPGLHVDGPSALMYPIAPPRN